MKSDFYKIYSLLNKHLKTLCVVAANTQSGTSTHVQQMAVGSITINRGGFNSIFIHFCQCHFNRLALFLRASNPLHYRNRVCVPSLINCSMLVSKNRFFFRITSISP